MPPNAKRDENRVTTLIAVSKDDGVTPVLLYADPTTHRLLTQTAVTTGATAPSSTPSFIGQMYIDTVLAKVYISTGTSASTDWKIMN